MHLIDERAFVVRLKAGDRHAELFGELEQARVDLGQRHLAVDVGLARAEQIQVRTMDDGDAPLHMSSLAIAPEATRMRKRALPATASGFSTTAIKYSSVSGRKMT